MSVERRIALIGDGTDLQELERALTSAFDVTIIEPDHVNDVLQDGIDGLVFYRCFAARSPPDVIPDPSSPVPVIVVADPRTISPGEIFSAGADAFVDATGPGVSERVRQRLNKRLKPPQDGTTAGLPDRRAELRALLENAPTPIGIVDTAGTIKYANQATADFVGAEDTAAVEGESVLSFAASETAPATERRLRSVIENRTSTAPMEQRFVGLDGAERVAVVTTTPITYEGEPAGQFVLNDITDYRKTSRALTRERDFVDRTLDALEDIFFVLDEDGEFVRWNQTLSAVTGYPDDQLDTMRMRDLIDPAHRSRLSAGSGSREADDGSIELDLVTNQGDRIPHEVRMVTVEGHDAVYTCGVGRDVTERTRRERKRQEFEQAVKHAGYAIFITDPDGTIRYVNRAFEEITGYTESDVLEETPRILKSGEHDDSYYEQLWNTVLAGEQWDREIINKRKNGEQYHAHQTITPISDDDGEVTGFIAIQRDISDLKAYEQELERRNEELERFASVVSHDLRSPLNVASGRIELARETLASGERKGVPGDLEDASEALERMGRIIDDLLRLARQGDVSEDVKPVNLGEVARTCIDHVMVERVDLQVADDPTILAAPGGLRNLFENLIRNANEHGSSGDREGYSGSEGEEGETSVTITVGTIESEDDIDGFYVADDGTGIAPDERDQIFESGYSSADDGTGLGLAIVKRIVEAHGWSITAAESRAGGARIEIRGVQTPAESSS